MAKISMAIREGDADGKNTRLMSWEVMAEKLDGALQSFARCMLHQSNMVVEVTCHVRRIVVDAMFCYSKLLRTGNYFARTVLAVEHLLVHCRDRFLQIEYTQPPEDTSPAARLREMILSFLLPRPRGRKNKKPTDKQIAEDNARREEFIQLFNGDLMGDKITHYCKVGCCDGPEDTAKKMARLLIKMASRFLSPNVCFSTKLYYKIIDSFTRRLT